MSTGGPVMCDEKWHGIKCSDMAGHDGDHVFVVPPSHAETVRPATAPIDPINPSYYVGKDGRDVFDMAENFDLNRYRTSAAKYLVRAGKKTPGVEGTVRDLEKARQCIDREIAVLKGER